MKQVLLALLLLFSVITIGTLTVGLPFAKQGLMVSNASTKSTNIVFGAEKDLSLLSKKIKWTPDGHITYITIGNTKRYFISGNQRTYTVDIPSSLSLDEGLSTNKAVVKENFGPDKNVSYRNFYATINSVIQTEKSNPRHLMAFAQYEEQAIKPDGTNDYANFTASVGLLESYDGGNTWRDFGPVIKGDDYLTPGTKISGAGEPCAITVDGYIYVYFVDWASGKKVTHADQIYLARTKIFTDGGLGAIEYLNTSGFGKDIKALQPVIKVPADENANYSSLPSISYNKYLGQYIAIFESNLGFYGTSSKDGINWADPKQVFAFSKPMSQRTTGDTWTSYPTLISDTSEKNDQTTIIKGNLYYGKGTFKKAEHELTVRTFEFK